MASFRTIDFVYREFHVERYAFIVGKYGVNMLCQMVEIYDYLGNFERVNIMLTVLCVIDWFSREMQKRHIHNLEDFSFKYSQFIKL